VCFAMCVTCGHSVAVQIKQIRKHIHEKRNNTQNTAYTSTLITKINTHTHTHTLTHINTHTHTHTLRNKLKQPKFKIYPNQSQYNQLYI
jgi:hypothetical protein